MTTRRCEELMCAACLVLIAVVFAVALVLGAVRPAGHHAPKCSAPECSEKGTGYGLYPYGASESETPAGMVCNWVSANEKVCRSLDFVNVRQFGGRE